VTTASDPIPAVDASATLAIEVHFDFVCPWCLIGKRQLDEAVRRFEAARPDTHVKVNWRSHQLLPATPLEGIDYQDFYIRRLGSPDAVAVRRLQVREAGRAANVEFSFDRIKLLPNTGVAHELVGRIGSHGTPVQQAAMIDRVFAAFFQEGQDIGRRDVLERLGADCGLSPEMLQRPVQPGWGSRRPFGDAAVSGVPFFVFNGTRAVSGAASAESLLESMLQAA
jgi:predicted DsbA family dithiol-disulfide isomerase